MAIRYAVADAVWSATSTWDGGTLPASTDDVFANGHTVSIDQTITVNSLKTIANTTPTIAVGGKFNVTAAATITVTAGNLGQDCGVNNSYVLGLQTGSFTVTVNSGLTGPTSGSFRDGVNIGAYSGTLTINGNVLGGSGTNSNALNAGNGSAAVTVNGNVTASAQTAINSYSSGSDSISLHVIGNVSGAVGAAGNAIKMSAGALTIDGNVVATSATTVTTWNAIINGDVTGGVNYNGIGVVFYGDGISGRTLTIRGSLRLGATPDAVAVNNNWNGGQFRFSGDIWCGGSTGAPSGYQGGFPIAGPWVAIGGETVNIHLVNDSTYPLDTGSAGPVLASTAGAGGPTVPTLGQLWPRGH